MATMLYHRSQPPRIVDTPQQVAQLLADGWADTPAAFVETIGDAEPLSHEVSDARTQEEPQPDAQAVDTTPAPTPARRPRKR